MTSSFRSRGIRIVAYPDLEPVLRTWLWLNASKEWLENNDAPWWYNERATLSYFAGAVWLNGGWAFEEFCAGKENISRGKPKPQNGRLDIAFKVKNEVTDTYFLAEAKQCWPILNNNMDIALNYVTQSLTKACDEACQVSERGYKRIGMVFVAPSIHVSKERFLKKYISELIDRLLAFKGATIAWTFPQKARRLRSSDNQYGDYICPGVALVIQKADYR